MSFVAIEQDKLASLDQIATVTPSIVSDGAASGCRAVDIRVYGGIDVRLLPDRGMDIAAAWYRGVPLAWISAVGETRPISAPKDMNWIEAFGGGLLTTCGLRNVGAASEGQGLHGTFSHLPARAVRVERTLEGGAQVFTVIATITDATATGRVLEVRRTIRTRTGRGLVQLIDVTRNLGVETEAAPLLYHVNIGAPLWDGDARLEIPSQHVVPRDDEAAAVSDWSSPPDAIEGGREWVCEHTEIEEARVQLTNARLGLALELRWDASTLPRLHQWVHPARRVYALGLEPANCSVLGRAADRAAGRLPILAPGESRTTSLEISVKGVTT